MTFVHLTRLMRMVNGLGIDVDIKLPASSLSMRATVNTGSIHQDSDSSAKEPRFADCDNEIPHRTVTCLESSAATFLMTSQKPNPLFFLEHVTLFCSNDNALLFAHCLTITKANHGGVCQYMLFYLLGQQIPSFCLW
jgi:hypothetical protein